MGNTNSNNYNLSFEDMEWIINHYSRLSNKVIIIHTLDTNQEDVLIKHTTFASDENDKINSFLKSNKDIHVCIYGKNAHDIKIHEKYNQLKDLGFVHVYIYIGGLFEWLLLQQLYGEDTYPVFIHPNTMLKYNWNETTPSTSYPYPSQSHSQSHYHQEDDQYHYNEETKGEENNIITMSNKISNFLFNYMLKYKPSQNTQMKLLLS